MQTIGYRLLVALVTFTIGLACARLTAFFLTAEQIGTVTTGQINVTRTRTHLRSNRPRFQLVSRSCESGCVETYETTDGEQISLVYACFSASAPDARRDMENFINEGSVVERRWGTDRQGATERTVVLYPKDETGASPAKIFSYHHGDVCFEYIEAGSLELALEFERSGTKDSW